MNVGIVVAMEKEIAPFLQKVNARLNKINGFSVWDFIWEDKKVYVCISSVGEICASAATQLLISHFDVKYVFNFGVVGALRSDIALLSTMYVGDVVHYDMDTSYFGDPVGRYSIFDDVAIQCNKQLIDLAQKIAPWPVVRCASADKFVDSKEDKTRLATQFGADICDMESAGILITSRLNNVPCLLVKAVSDSLSGGGKEFASSCQLAATGYMNFITQLLGNLK
ncbi:MAG: 5'-methylthioadenosine/S-adenosylhomocysteine nucleosidase [Clostridia bacterium]|nr:5'-methylthioadenosine/S-adenosylhomocysteine nucleosidase [Clostridia bacterium]